MDFHSYSRTLEVHNQLEQAKKPGQEFCDKFNWKLSKFYDVIQRPDKITWVGGTIYRTQTPTTHIWYRSKKNKRHHIWVEFTINGDGYIIIVKNNIEISEKTYGFKIITTPYPNICDTIREFYDSDETYQYIMNSY